MNKHYTPKIEEFHVGFEYEHKNLPDGEDAEWFPHIFNKHCDAQVHDTMERRVKHLDREDIESFDFDFIKTNKMTDWYEIEFCGVRLPESSYSFWKVYLRHDPERNLVKIEADVSSGDRETFFEGTIKNKSKLKEILTDIGILK